MCQNEWKCAAVLHYNISPWENSCTLSFIGAHSVSGTYEDFVIKYSLFFESLSAMKKSFSWILLGNSGKKSKMIKEILVICLLSIKLYRTCRNEWQCATVLYFTSLYLENNCTLPFIVPGSVSAHDDSASEKTYFLCESIYVLNITYILIFSAVVAGFYTMMLWLTHL